MTGPEHGVIIAIAPTSRGFGFAVFGAPARLLDWGVKEARSDKNRLATQKVGRMIRDIKPAVVVIENWVHASCRRSARVRTLLVDVAVLASKSGSTAMVYSRHHVRQAFGKSGKSKDAIAAAIAAQLPALRPWLPPKRRIWESEHHSMAIFEAAALAMTHFSGLRVSVEPQGAIGAPL
jgi:hypothetical protein